MKMIMMAAHVNVNVNTRIFNDLSLIATVEGLVCTF